MDTPKFMELCKKAYKFGDCLELVFADAMGGDDKLFDFIKNDPDLNTLLKNRLEKNNISDFDVQKIDEYDPQCYWGEEMEEMIYSKLPPNLQMSVSKQLKMMG